MHIVYLFISLQTESLFIRISVYFMNKRESLIRELIQTRKVRSQEELVQLLAERGIHTTQATLSRDLKRMQIFKQHDPSGESCYVLPAATRTAQTILLSDSRAGESIVSIAFSGQLGVIKTLPGCANMVGALVDEHGHPDLMGTIAGDNTLLLILRSGTSHTAFLNFLEHFIPGLSSRLTDKQN